MESDVLRNDPDSENRLSLGGRKRSSRRSSILKASKSPMKVLEDIDPNSMGSGDKENRDVKKTRRSSSRRVSFAQTYEVKEFCKDDGWNEWQKANETGEHIDQETEKAGLPSEYRQPNVTIKGLESLLKGDIQNPSQQPQDDPNMDFTVYCNSTFNEQQQADKTDGFSRDTTLNALDLTCHGQGLIDQENIAPTATLTANYDEMDFTTVCQARRHIDEVSYPIERTVVFSSNTAELNALDMTCHNHGIINTDENNYKAPEEGLSKFSATSFLNSLMTKPPQQSPPLSNTSQVMAQETKKVDAVGFLLRLSTPQPQKQSEMVPKQDASNRLFSEGLDSSIPNPCEQEEEESMEMTTCIDVPLETTESSISIPVPPSSSVHVEQMDMTSCVPPLLRAQVHSIVQEAQMDMTTCVPPLSMAKGHSMVQGAHMDMTTCVPPVLKSQGHSIIQEATMDMTTCVAPLSMAQGHSMVQEAHMDMTTCVPPVSKSQGHSMMQEAHMDMTTCVPTTAMPHGHPTVQEAQMDMTTCVPPITRPQGHAMVQEAHMDMTTCVPPTAMPHEHPTVQEAHMDMTTCVPTITRPQGHSIVQEAHMDMTTCVPPTAMPHEHPTVQEAHMDMTACVPTITRPQGHSIVQEAHMDMTTCVPTITRPQEYSMVQEAQMGTTTCVPPTSSHQNHSIVQEAQTLSSNSLQSINLKENSNTQESICEQDVAKTSFQLVNSFGDKSLISTANPLDDLEDTSQSYWRKDVAPRTSTSFIETATNKITDFLNQEAPQIRSEPVYSFKALENYNQNFMSRTMPLLGSQRPKKSGFQSLPMLSSTFLDSEPNTNDPQITHGPVCDVPISKYCSQTAKKRKMTHDDITVSPAKQAALEPQLYEQSTAENNTNIMEKEQTATLTEEPQQAIDKTEDESRTFVLEKQQSETPSEELQQAPEKTGKENHTFVLESGQEIPGQTLEENADVNHTFVLEKQELTLEVSKQPDIDKENGDKDTEQEHEECNEKLADSDGEISFKACTPGKAMPEDQDNITDTLAHSALVGLMDEPTLEFSTDVFDDTDNGVGQKKDGNEGKEQTAAVQENGQETASLQTRKRSTNLSVICEESEGDCSKGPSTFNAKHDTNKTKMTVAELLKRANISFNCAIASVQGSRRSIFGCIKRPEKPKEEKEFIELSMVLKPQAIHYGEFCATIQQDIEQLKTKMKEKEQELDNSDTPILYYTNEDEMSELAKKLKELKKTVCKERANARWIERSGVMKKKLASVLKNNRDDVSSDVSTINDCLAVAKDCDKLLDNIDDELETGVQGLRESLQKISEENLNVEETQSTLKQKTAELDAREAELQQLEEKRSSFISTKETLTAEKENLEREKYESEALLAKALDEVSLDQEVDELEEKYDLLKRLFEWELDEWDEHHAKYLFLHQTLELLINFDTHQGGSTNTSKTVENISISSRLADNSHISAKFAHSLIQRNLDMKELVQMSPTSSSLSKVLDHVSQIVSTARGIGDELFDVSFNKLMTISDDSVSVVFSSVKNFMKFIVELKIDVTKYPENVGIAVTQKIGKPCCQDVVDALKALPIGPRYITRLVETARHLVETK